MGLVPRNIPDKINYYALRQALWTAQAVNIGLTSPQMVTMSGLISTASDALTDQGNAQSAAKAATVTLHNAVQAMADYGSELIKEIKVKAGQVGPSVYALANIDPPAPPSPTPPPGPITNFVASFDGAAALILKWKCTSPNGGAVYQLWRRVNLADEFTFIGASGAKEFTDATIPAGSSQVTYQIQATRPTGAGPWAQFNVTFGTGGGSMTVTQRPPVKIAS
jgi:hypothetical protein